MKLQIIGVGDRLTQSLPARGVWIEIGALADGVSAQERSLPARGVWIEIKTPVSVSDI